jgi:hypothetical protein
MGFLDAGPCAVIVRSSEYFYHNLGPSRPGHLGSKFNCNLSTRNPNEYGCCLVPEYKRVAKGITNHYSCKKCMPLRILFGFNALWESDKEDY